MNHNIESFIREYLKEINEDNAAIFAGAGLSAPAGFVDWLELLRPVAEELQLDIEKENDLIAIAQYHFNEQGNNRHTLNQLLIEKLDISSDPTDNHRILARLPISVYWTTNYDQLIENSLREAGKIPDVKYVTAHLATTKTRRDAVVYKMHGDIQHPHEAILIRDDYEKYHLSHGAFINALSGDLVSKTFLFIGFSFTDPNLNYILSRVRVVYRENQRRHYCIVKRRVKQNNESDVDFSYAETRQKLWIADLKRFNIRTLIVEDYCQITEILCRIERTFRQRTIFISGSAEEYGSWNKQATEEFLRDLSRALVQKEYRIATGVGFGVGDSIITGAIEQIFRDRAGHIEDSLIMRPFPRAQLDAKLRDELWEKYRQELISNAGICLVVLGNKKVDGKIYDAQGVRREFEIAYQHGLFLIPVGATGYMSRVLWDEVMQSFEKFYPNAKSDLKDNFRRLGDTVENPNMLISAVLEFIACLTKE